MSTQKLLPICLLLFVFSSALAACNERSKLAGEFEVAVIVDTTSDPVSREQAQAIIDLADERLINLTGFGLKLVDFVEDDSGGAMESLVQNYMANNSSLPNGFVIFSVGDDDQAKINRAYARQYQGPAGFRNAFASPFRPAGTLYAGILQFNYHYAACGYGGDDAVQSRAAIGDECPGGAGQVCAEWAGMQVCPAALPFLEGQTPADMASDAVIHEFMHAFGQRRGGDHYGHEECNLAMGWPLDHYDHDESVAYNGFCPDAYDVFVESYQP